MDLPVRVSVGHLDDGLQNAGVRLDQALETFADFIECQTMGYPGHGVDRSVFDQADDSREIPRKGVARGKQVHFLAVKGWMDEGDFLGRDSDVDE